VHCHGADESQSGLRLDAARLAALGGDGGSTIVPGKSGESLLYRALLGKGDVAAMPADSDAFERGKGARRRN
jgi:hypothetical protein